MYQNSHHLAMALDIIYVALSAEGYQDLKRIWMMLKTKVGVAGSWGSCLATKLCWRNSDALAFLLVGLSVILPITTTLSIQSCAMLCGLKSHFTGNRPFSTMNAMLMRPGFMAVAKLSLQETLVIKWAGEGKSSWETAIILQTSERAVKYHLANVYRKLQVSRKPQAVIQAYKMGLLV